jgi:hypothetical protein
MRKIIVCTLFMLSVFSLNQLTAAAQNDVRLYKVLATKKTSTMEKEMNEAASVGYRFEGVSGGETAFGGSEVVVIMSKADKTGEGNRFQYKLLATSKTSTMQKEMQQAGNAGYEYKGQTVFETTFGGEEVVILRKEVTTK